MILLANFSFRNKNNNNIFKWIIRAYWYLKFIDTQEIWQINFHGQLPFSSFANEKQMIYINQFKSFTQSKGINQFIKIIIQMNFKDFRRDTCWCIFTMTNFYQKLLFELLVITRFFTLECCFRSTCSHLEPLTPPSESQIYDWGEARSRRQYRRTTRLGPPAKQRRIKGYVSGPYGTLSRHLDVRAKLSFCRRPLPCCWRACR